MMDMLAVVEAKSDQMNAVDLLGGPKTIQITRVVVRKPDTDQPVSVFYEGDNGKPWKPCKSMCRVLLKVYGSDSKKYVGKSVTLFRDEDVTWAGRKEGGIRISHMSDIEAEISVPLTKSRGHGMLYKVSPLVVDMGNVDEEVDYQELMKKGQDSAAYGSTEYKEFFMSLSKSDKKRLDDSGDHEKLKAIAIANADEIPVDPTSQDQEAGNVEPDAEHAPHDSGSTTREPITDEKKHLSRNDIIKSLGDCKTDEEVDTLITCQSLGIAKKSEGDQITISNAAIDRKKELSNG